MEEDSGFSLFAPSRSAKCPVAPKAIQNADQSPDPKEEVKEMEIKDFKNLILDHWQIETLTGLSILKPTQVQASCIPAILKGLDVSAAARTGSGKTAAFALPILKKLSEDPFGVYALVLTPTRELALQIVEQFKVLGRSIKVSVSAVMGGMDMMKQTLELAKKPHIVVGTPGRIADLLDSSPDALDLSRIRFLVFDEADRLVGPGSTFKEGGELETIIAKCNPKAQHLLFSATMSPAVEQYAAERFGSEADKKIFYHRANEEFGTVDKIAQKYLLIPSQIRDAYLSYLCSVTFEGKSMIIFVGKCKTAELVLRMLRELGLRVVALHSKMTQNDRIASLARFKSGQVPILVSTDVGSRGLDIPSVQVVFNMDVPADARDYVHRIGRTARAGRSGVALTFVHELDIDLIKNIEKCIGKRLDAFEEAPEEKVVLADLNKVIAAKRAASMSLLDRKFGEKEMINKKKWGKMATNGAKVKKSKSKK